MTREFLIVKWFSTQTMIPRLNVHENLRQNLGMQILSHLGLPSGKAYFFEIEGAIHTQKYIRTREGVNTSAPKVILQGKPDIVV